MIEECERFHKKFDNRCIKIKKERNNVLFIRIIYIFFYKQQIFVITEQLSTSTKIKYLCFYFKYEKVALVIVFFFYITKKKKIIQNSYEECSDRNEKCLFGRT